MKIIGIDGSPRKNGNTEKLLKKVLAGATEAGGATEFLKLADLTIKYCQGCGTCRATGECVMRDDMDRVVDAIQQSDAVVLGSPIYAWQVSGNTKVFMDRLCRLLTPKYESRLNGPKKIAFVYILLRPSKPERRSPWLSVSSVVQSVSVLCALRLSAVQPVSLTSRSPR